MTVRVRCTRKEEAGWGKKTPTVFKAETWILQAGAQENYGKQVDLHHKASGI